MIKDSFIRLPKEEVIEKCEKTLKFIATWKDEKTTEFVNSQMKKANKSWLRKLFRRPQLTFDEAKDKYFVSNEFGSRYHWITNFWYDENKAVKRLLRAAKASKDDVYISSSDLGLINYSIGK